MEDNLKRFARQHRDEFDTHEPPAGLWSRIEHGMVQPVPAQTSRPVFKMLLKAAAAAIIVFLAGTGVYYLLKKDTPAAPVPEVAVNKPPSAADKGPDTNNIASLAPDYAGQVYQFAVMINTKHKELETLTAGDTGLCNQFDNDFYQLDSVYTVLKEQLPGSPNREELLQALIHNLELQLEVLTHQLDMIQEIHNNKKDNYETITQKSI